MDFEGSGYLEIFSESSYSVVLKLESLGVLQSSGQANTKFRVFYSASGSIGTLGSSKEFISPYIMRGGLSLSSTSARVYDASLDFGFESSYLSYGNGDPDFNITLASEWQANSGNYYWYRVIACCRVYPEQTPEAISYFGRLQKNPIINLNGKTELTSQALAPSLQDPKCGPQRVAMITAVVARDLDEVCSILKNPKLGPPVKFQVISVKKYSDPIGTRKTSISCSSLSNGSKTVIENQEFCNMPECLELCLDYDLAEESSNSTTGSYRPIIFHMSVILDIFYHESNGLISISGKAQILYLNTTGSGGVEVSGNAKINSPNFNYNSDLMLDLSGNVDFIIKPLMRSFSGSINLEGGTLEFVSPIVNYNPEASIILESSSEINFSILYNSHIVLNLFGVAENSVDQTYYYEPEGSIIVDSSSSFGSSYYEYETYGSFLVFGSSSDIISANRQYIAQGAITLSRSVSKFGRCIDSQNQISISGTAMPNNTPAFRFNGGLEFGGIAADVISPNRNFVSDGFVDFDGSSDVSFTNFGILVAYANFSASYSNLEIDSSSKVTSGSSDLTIDQGFVDACGCLSIGLNVNLLHNLQYAGVFSGFLDRNSSIDFGSNMNLRYKARTNSWYNTLNFSGKSEDNQNVSWQFIIELSCTNLIENQVYDNQSLKFNFMARYKKPSGIFTTSFVVNIDPAQVCKDNKNRLSSTIIYDNYDNVVYINSVSNNYYKLIDEIGMFTNDYWGKKLDYSVVKPKYCTPSTTTTSKAKPKVSGAFPQFKINYNNTTINNIDKAIGSGCGITIDNPTRNNV